MRKVMILILSITILNYNINVFADTSVQHEYSSIENTESVGDIEEKSILSSGGIDCRRDITEIQTMTDRPASILTKRKEARYILLNWKKGDTVIVGYIMKQQVNREEQDTIVLPDKEGRNSRGNRRSKSTTIVSDKMSEENTEL